MIVGAIRIYKISLPERWDTGDNTCVTPLLRGDRGRAAIAEVTDDARFPGGRPLFILPSFGRPWPGRV